MKSLLKIITKIFLSIIIFCNLFFVFGVNHVYAVDKNLNDECAPGVDKCLQGNCMQDTATAYHCLVAFKPQIEIPGVGSAIIKPGNSTKALGEYIKGFYSYAVGITAILATVVLMIGGFQWIIAGGSGEKIGEAKAWITAALSGLVLALSSYMILNLVNPDLVNFVVKDIKVIKAIPPEGKEGCCLRTVGGTVTAFDTKASKCEEGGDVFKEGFKKLGNTCAHPCQPPAIRLLAGMVRDPETINECKGRCISGGKIIDATNSFWFGPIEDAYCCVCK